MFMVQPYLLSSILKVLLIPVVSMEAGLGSKLLAYMVILIPLQELPFLLKVKAHDNLLMLVSPSSLEAIDPR